MPDQITDPQDPRLADYVALTDVALRRRIEPEGGLYIAESEKVIRRALAAGHRPRSYLMAQRWLTDLGDVVADAEAHGIPVYVGEHSTIESLTGFHLHRGALAAMHRPTLPAVADGRVELSGAFQSKDPATAFVLERLDALGLDLELREGSVVSKALRLPDQDIRIGLVPEFLPLALVMALRAKRTVRVLLPGDGQWADPVS